MQKTAKFSKIEKSSTFLKKEAPKIFACAGLFFEKGGGALKTYFTTLPLKKRMILDKGVTH